MTIQDHRTERDFLGERNLPAQALYGLQSLRARENFPDTTPFHPEWFRAMGMVKMACYLSYQKYCRALEDKMDLAAVPFTLLPPRLVEKLIDSAGEISKGLHYEHFIVPALSGGAGTSINMNINEIIANLSLLKLGRQTGDYQIADPIEAANVFQSTNDVVPTALRIALLYQLEVLEKTINTLRQHTEKLETNSHHLLRLAYTQLQEAVPSSFGKLFSAYNEALSRDWWRVSKCFERIKQVNLGGGAIGSGLGIPRFFIMDVVQQLQQCSKLPVGRSENLTDTTSNLDSLAEVHAILKAHAINLEKISSDLRLLSSGLGGKADITLPRKQIGSSIMPGKVNPVIPEFVIGIAHKVYANDQIISSLCGQGMLELNAYLPLIGHALLESVKLLIAAGDSMHNHLFNGLIINSLQAKESLMRSPVITTAFTPLIGYHRAAEMAAYMKEMDCDVLVCNRHFSYLTENQIHRILLPENLLKLGFTIEDIKDQD